jgi:hypothetical protein
LVLRIIEYLCVAATLTTIPISAQMAEPILAKTAIPFAQGAGAVKLDFAGGIGPSGGGSQIIPEATIEVGIGKGLEALARFPLLRVTPRLGGPAVIGGGQLAVGARYLLAGGAERVYAIALQAIVETPTGDTRLVGNATQVMPAVFADWRPAHPIVVYSDLLFDRSIGGTGPGAGFFGYGGAVAWLATAHWVPALEFAGSTNTLTGRTQLVGLPEIIVRVGTHWELKTGLTFGLNPQTPRLGLRAQVDWFWGTRK